MNRIINTWSVIAVMGLAFTCSARVQQVQFDISSAYNYDFFISTNEQNEAMSYNPEQNWAGMGSRGVNTVFGDHSINNPNYTYIWQGQYSGDLNAGIPTNGVYTTSYGNFGFCRKFGVALDKVPNGGFGNPQVPSNTVLPSLVMTNYLQPNIVLAWIPHTGSPSAYKLSFDINLPVPQRGKYVDANFIVLGNSKGCKIYANYDNGAGGTNQVKVFDQPNGNGFPDIQTASPPNIYTQCGFWAPGWSNAADYTFIRPTANYYMFMLANPVQLDPHKTLLGFTLAIPGVAWDGGEASAILAATGTMFSDYGTRFFFR